MIKGKAKTPLSILLRIVSAMLVLMNSTFMPILGSVADVFAAQSDSVAITIHLITNNAPSRITDLVASKTSYEGSIQLHWTSPASVNQLNSYELRYATFSVVSLASNTTAWWNNPNTGTELIGSPKVSGSQELCVLGGLEPGVIYYFGMRSKDSANHVSDYDTNMYAVQASTTATDLVPVAPTGFSANLINNSLTSPVKLSWNNMAGKTGYIDFDYYRVYRSTFQAPLLQYTPLTDTATTTYLDTAILTGTTYYYYVKAYDKMPIVLVSPASETKSILRRSTNISYFELTHGSTATVNAMIPVTVRACDTTGLTIDVYTGTATFTSTGRGVVLPSSYTFRASDHGIHTIYVSDEYVENITVTAKQQDNPTVTGTSKSLHITGTYVSYTDSVIPNKVIQGQKDIAVMQFALATSSGTSVWTNMQVDCTGYFTNSDLSYAKIFRETGDSSYSPFQDTFVSSAVFSSGKVNITIPAEAITTVQQTYYLVYDIPLSATANHTIGAAVNGTGYFTFSSGLPMGKNNLPAVTTKASILALPHKPAKITTVVASANSLLEGSVTLSWIAPEKYEGLSITNDKVNGYLINYATFSVASLSGDTTAWLNNSSQYTDTHCSLPGYAEAETLSLMPGTSYYFAVRAFNNNTSIQLAADIDLTSTNIQAKAFAVDFVPVAPEGFKAVLVSTIPVPYAKLMWNDMTARKGYVDFDYYKIYRANSNDLTYSALATLSGTAYTDSNIDAGVTYYYYITAVDKPPVVYESTNSATASIYIVANKPMVLPPTVYDTVKTLQPSGVSLAVVNNKAVVSWDAPVNNVDNTPVKDEDSFLVYRSTDLFTNWNVVSTITFTSTSRNSWADTSVTVPNAGSPMKAQTSALTTSNSSVYYYKVTSIDRSGNESADSMILDTSVDFNVISISSDTRMIVAIPASIAKQLYKANNSIKDNVIIFSREVESDKEDYNAWKTYDIYPVKASNLERLPNMSFVEPIVHIVWQYTNTSNVSVLSKVVNNNLPVLPSQLYDAQFSLYWNNGLEWVKLGKDSFGGAISFQTARLGKYMIKESMKATSFTLNKVYPTIFTPNGDGKNDVVNFVFENPKDSSISGNIFDLRGRLVAKLKIGIAKNFLLWDGMTDSGYIADAGTYIYQIDAKGSDSKVVNGIVIVAK